ALFDLTEREHVPRVVLHAMLDGRDTPPRSGLEFLRETLDRMKGRVQLGRAEPHAPALGELLADGGKGRMIQIRFRAQGNGSSVGDKCGKSLCACSAIGMTRSEPSPRSQNCGHRAVGILNPPLEGATTRAGFAERVVRCGLVESDVQIGKAGHKTGPESELEPGPAKANKLYLSERRNPPEGGLRNTETMRRVVTAPPRACACRLS
ncbi:MAG: hypothetical protein H7210_06780, partial [Pyrinomonadaceae bacterium]|nr:hypothetical protein [Phycisphaerales bacterium]